jgi:hypothetical protein
MDGVGAQYHPGGGAAAPGPAVPDRVRLPLDFDPDRLKEDLDRFEGEQWVRHTARQNYQGQWSILPLRAAAGETHPLRLVNVDPTATHFADTAWLDRAPYFRAAIERFQCPLRNVRLMRLAAGSEILSHSDLDLDVESGRARLHVPITTNDKVEFRVNGRPVALEPGSCWYLKLTDPHEAANRGDTDRVHLVIDSEVNDWLMDMLRRGTTA